MPGKMLTIFGIKLVDHDRNVDQIRAHVVASKELLISLNTEGLPDLLNPCSFDQWGCFYADHELNFVGKHVSLADMKYLIYFIEQIANYMFCFDFNVCFYYFPYLTRFFIIDSTVCCACCT
jgi:hypothetical protein